MALQRIDDRDSSIAYSSGWGLGGAPNEYDSSNTYAPLQGQTATVKFRGIGIAVYGTIQRSSPGVPPPQSLYTLDGTSTAVYVEQQDGDTHYQQQFYQSPILSNGPHSLVVKNALQNSAAYFLDYFVVIKGDDSPTVPSSSSSTFIPSTTSPTSTFSSASALTTTITRTSNSSTPVFVNGTILFVPVTSYRSLTSASGVSPTAPSGIITSNAVPATANSNNPMRSILGLAIGGTVTLVLSLLVVLFLRLRRRKKRKIDDHIVSRFPITPANGNPLSMSSTENTHSSPGRSSCSSSLKNQTSSSHNSNGAVDQSPLPYDQAGPSNLSSSSPPAYSLNDPAVQPPQILPSKLGDEFHPSNRSGGQL